MPFNRYLVPSDFGPGTVEPCAYAETYREIQAVLGARGECAAGGL